MALQALPDPEEYKVETGPDGTVMMFEAEAVRWNEIKLEGPKDRIAEPLKRNQFFKALISGRVDSIRHEADKYGNLGRVHIAEVLAIELVE